MTLQVIKAEDVRDGEPRWWFVAQIDAETSMARDAKCTPDMLHTADRRAFKREHGWWPRFAIVDRPAPHYPPMPGAGAPRDPSRIEPILARLRAAWRRSPDLRLGQLIVGSIPIGHLDRADAIRRLFNAECHEFGAAGAPVEWPAPSTAQPPPVLDLDALAEAERAMTAGAWAANIFTTHVANSTQETQWHEAVVGSDVVCETECSALEDETAIGAANIRGIVALRNAAPHLIAEARAAVALRAQICRLVSSQAIESDRLCQHHDADVVALAEVATLRERLAEAKRLGLEACTAWCRIVGSDGDDDGIAAVEKIAAELEAL